MGCINLEISWGQLFFKFVLLLAWDHMKRILKVLRMSEAHI